MRRAISKILGTDYDVIEAENGEDAWTILLNDNSIQLLFTDLSMPFLDGFGLLERIRTSDDPRLHELPVIVITGKDDDEKSKKEALDKGASDFITKPFDSIQLQARAKSHINFKQAASKLSEASSKLEKLAAIDVTTGLGGQRYFCKVGEETLAYAKRHSMQFVTVRMDIDGFNDLFVKYGQQIIDYILRNIGEKLTSVIRQQDTLARVGVYKFAIILKETSLDEAILLTERIRQEIQATRFKLSRNEELIKLTVSIGLYEPEPGLEQTFKEVIDKTEKYLNDALAAGGNCIISHARTEMEVKTPLEEVNFLELLEKIKANNFDDILPKVDSILYHITPLLKFLADNERQKLQTLLRQISRK
jgi:diguanylate cyclase (GGDEF)-like protein